MKLGFITAICEGMTIWNVWKLHAGRKGARRGVMQGSAISMWPV